MTDTSIALHVEGVTKRFGGLVAVNNISFTLPANKVLGLIGPNGSGKTTMIKMLTGIARPTKERIAISGFSGANTAGLQRIARPHPENMSRTAQMVCPATLGQSRDSHLSDTASSIILVLKNEYGCHL